MNNLRSEFEKLPEVAIIFEGLHPTIIWFCKTSNLYATSFDGFSDKVKFLNGALYAFKEQQKKIDEIDKHFQSLISESELWGFSSDQATRQIELIQELLK